MNISHTRRGAGKQHHGATPAGAVYVGPSPSGAWHLWRLPPRSPSYTGPWRNYKLVTDSSSVKANFYLGYNVAERRLARNHDQKTLAEFQTELLHWLMGVLVGEA